MNFREYQVEASRTLDTSMGYSNQLTNYGLGLAGEAGEVVEMIKKGCFHGHGIDMTELAKELGDVLWYISAIATLNNLDLGIIANNNIEKLLKRYPKGFDTSMSKNRIEYRGQAVNGEV